MAGSNLENIITDNSLSSTADLLKLKTLLHTRIAAAFEMHDRQASATGSSMSESWEMANKSLELLESDPREAFNFAISLILNPRSKNDLGNDLNRWMQETTALTILGNDSQIPLLKEFLKSDPRRDRIASYLIRQISQDLSRFKTGADFSDPQGFCTLQSLFISSKFFSDDDVLCNRISSLAAKRCHDVDVRPAVRVLAEGDCDYLGALLN